MLQKKTQPFPFNRHLTSYLFVIVGKSSLFTFLIKKKKFFEGSRRGSSTGSVGRELPSFESTPNGWDKKKNHILKTSILTICSFLFIKQSPFTEKNLVQSFDHKVEAIKKPNQLVVLKLPKFHHSKNLQFPKSKNTSIQQRK